MMKPQPRHSWWKQTPQTLRPPSASFTAKTHTSLRSRRAFGNPFYVNFKPPRRRIGSSGLNLEQERFRIGIPNRFRLNCSDLGEGELKISSHPASAADVIVKHSTGEGGELFYQCQIIPKKVGHHEIWVKFDGHHIEESPYKVHFKPRGDAAKCV